MRWIVQIPFPSCKPAGLGRYVSSTLSVTRRTLWPFRAETTQNMGVYTHMGLIAPTDIFATEKIKGEWVLSWCAVLMDDQVKELQDDENLAVVPKSCGAKQGAYPVRSPYSIGRLTPRTTSFLSDRTLRWTWCGTVIAVFDSNAS